MTFVGLARTAEEYCSPELLEAEGLLSVNAYSRLITVVVSVRTEAVRPGSNSVTKCWSSVASSPDQSLRRFKWLLKRSKLQSHHKSKIERFPCNLQSSTLQGRLCWLFQRGLRVRLGTAGGVEAVMVEVGVDIDSYFGCFKGVSKSVKVYFVV